MKYKALLFSLFATGPDTFDIIQHELQFVNTKFEIFMQIFRRHTIKKLTPNAIPHKIKSRDIKNVKVG